MTLLVITLSKKVYNVKYEKSIFVFNLFCWDWLFLNWVSFTPLRFFSLGGEKRVERSTYFDLENQKKSSRKKPLPFRGIWCLSFLFLFFSANLIPTDCPIRPPTQKEKLLSISPKRKFSSVYFELLIEFIFANLFDLWKPVCLFVALKSQHHFEL